MASYITPTYNPWQGVVAEWHEDCMRTRFSPQELPYQCSACGSGVEDGEYVVYVTLGNKPKAPYQRLERRGYELPLIVHTACCKRLLGKATAG